ncbi:MAG: hypothetical protein P8H32_08355 [Oceanicoccus sp.]|uniref:hypothetical protein n=1 Tax=Oceanicoccus sp. TaxID=2691044 RepID=UPI0026356386|nr:hypothetical protein [Oceanicoccus sp.]MDG1773428.1 hypothetical protein [Oceanicoccus sp.]
MSMNSLEEEIKKSEAKKKARKAKPGGLPKLINIPRNWAHQAISYLDRGELYFRIISQVLETALVYYLLAWLLALDSWIIFAIAFVIVHTLNWIFNSTFWAIIIFTFPWLRNPGEKATCDFLNDMAVRLRKSESIVGMAMYGSVTRKVWHDRSDLDMRIVRKPGLKYWLPANLIMLRERIIATMAIQPMDMFLADGVKFLGLLRADEPPVFMILRDEALSKAYPGFEAIDEIHSLCE